MSEYILPKTGHKAHVGVLNDADLVDVLALQETVRAALPAEMKMFVLPQPIAYFQNLLAGHDGIMVGIRTDGQLIAQMAIMGPVDLREALALRLFTKNDIAFHHAALTDSVVAFKSMAVHPSWRGNELSQHLVTCALEQPTVRMAAHVFAQISAANKRSWNVFARQGFGIVAGAYDPADNQPRFIFQKPAFGFDFAPAIIADEVDPLEDFPAIVNLTQREALVGVYEQAGDTALTFKRNREASNLLPTVAQIKNGA
ncbi:MAG: GNAT family N-acetyltransferase [Alphaproteobacteria bacterium]|nr:GNAT family N-acetyltransferase [Alphaproteobacteria bacterium]